MLRQNAYPRASLAAASIPIDGNGGEVRLCVARTIRLVARLAVVPFAAATAAVAGGLFVILLPICGIASLAEAAAKASWALVRRAFRHPGSSEPLFSSKLTCDNPSRR